MEERGVVGRVADRPLSVGVQEGTGRVYGVRPARCRPVFGGGTSDHALEAHFRIQKTFCSSVRAVAPVGFVRFLFRMAGRVEMELTTVFCLFLAAIQICTIFGG